MTLRDLDLELVAAVIALFGYTIGGLFLASDQQILAAWATIVAGVIGSLVMIVAILRSY